MPLATPRSATAFVATATRGGIAAAGTIAWTLLAQDSREPDGSIPYDDDTGLQEVTVVATNEDGTAARHYAYVGIGGTTFPYVITKLLAYGEGLTVIADRVLIERGQAIWISADADNLVAFYCERQPWYQPKP